MIEHQSRTRRFDRAYQVWRGDPPTKKPGNKDWRSAMNPKYAMQIVDQALANLAEGIPSVTVQPRRPGDEGAAEALEHTLTYFADRDFLAEKEVAVTQTALILGVSVGKNQWLYAEDLRQGRNVVTDDRPTFTPWDPYHAWWDPQAYDVDSASYVVLRSYPTKHELLMRAYDEQTGTGSYKNLDLLWGSATPKPETQSAQEMLLAPPPDVLKDRFEVLEVWKETPRGTWLTVIGNRKILLRDGPSPYRMRGKPITISNSRPDLFRIEGISETELIDDVQRALQTIGNLRLDQLKMTVMRGATVRNTVDMRQLVFQPGFMWPVDDHGDVKMVEMSPLPPEAYREDELLLGRLQWLTGSSPYVTGVSASGGAPTDSTATGTSLLTQSASKLLMMKGQIIHNRTWNRTFLQWGSLTRQFLSDDTAIRIMGPGGKIDWRTYKRGDLVEDFDVKIEAGDQSATIQQARAEILQLLQIMTPWIQAGWCDPKPILQKVAKLFGFPSANDLIRQPPPAAAPGPVPKVVLSGDLTPEQEAMLAQQGGFAQQGGSLPQPGGPPQQLGNGQVSPHPALSVIAGHRA